MIPRHGRGRAVVRAVTIPRGAIVQSNDTATSLPNRAQAISISSQIGRLYPAEPTITLNGECRRAIANQITTASKRRLLRSTGAIVQEIWPAVCRVVRLQPGL